LIAASLASVAGVVPQAHALAAHELDRIPYVRRDHMLALERLQLSERHSPASFERKR